MSFLICLPPRELKLQIAQLSRSLSQASLHLRNRQWNLPQRSQEKMMKMHLQRSRVQTHISAQSKDLHLLKRILRTSVKTLLRRPETLRGGGKRLKRMKNWATSTLRTVTNARMRKTGTIKRLFPNLLWRGWETWRIKTTLRIKRTSRQLTESLQLKF